MEARHLEVARRINHLDLTSIAERLKLKESWGLKRLAEAEREYRRFLLLLALYPDATFIPWSDDLDLFWHYHILDSRKYAEDCIEVLGRFVHHDPNVTGSPEKYERDRRLTNATYRGQFSGDGGPSLGFDFGGGLNFWWLSQDQFPPYGNNPAWVKEADADQVEGDNEGEGDAGSGEGSDGSDDCASSSCSSSACGSGCGGGGCGSD